MEVYCNASLNIKSVLNLLNVHTHGELTSLNTPNAYSVLYMHEKNRYNSPFISFIGVKS